MDQSMLFLAANVFSTTAVDSALVRDTNGIINNPMISINDLDPENIFSPPNITEPETCLAMMKLGVGPEDLVKMTKNDILKIPGNENLRQRVANEIERRRMDTINRIKDERSNFVAQKTAETLHSSATAYSLPSKDTNYVEDSRRRIEKLKRKQVVNLINTQIQRKQIMESDINSKQRIEEQRMKKRQDLVSKREQEDEKSRALSERAKILKEEKKMIANSILAKQRQDEERRLTFQEEFQRKNEEEKQKSNEQRMQKLEQIRTQQRQREIEEIEKAEKAIALAKEKQEKHDQKKEDVLRKLKEQQKANELKYQEKMERIKERERQQRNETEEKIKRKNDQAEALIQIEHEKQLEELRKKKEIEQQRKRDKSGNAIGEKTGDIIDQNIESLQKEMKQKQMKAEENLRALSLSRKQKFIEVNEQIKQKSLSCLAAKKQREEFLAEKALNSLQKFDKASQKIGEMREKALLLRQEKAAQTYLNLRIGEEKAKRLSRMKQFEVMMQAQKTKTKLETIAEMKRRKIEAQMKELEAAKKHEAMEMDELLRARMEIEINPEIDPAEIAKKLNISVAELNGAAIATKSTAAKAEMQPPVTMQVHPNMKQKIMPNAEKKTTNHQLPKL